VGWHNPVGVGEWFLGRLPRVAPGRGTARPWAGMRNPVGVLPIGWGRGEFLWVFVPDGKLTQRRKEAEPLSSGWRLALQAPISDQAFAVQCPITLHFWQNSKRPVLVAAPFLCDLCILSQPPHPPKPGSFHGDTICRTVEHLPSISHPLATAGSAVRGLPASAYSAWSAVKSLPPAPSVLSVKSVVKHHSAT
jgi:hypothetical protein